MLEITRTEAKLTLPKGTKVFLHEGVFYVRFGAVSPNLPDIETTFSASQDWVQSVERSKIQSTTVKEVAQSSDENNIAADAAKPSAAIAEVVQIPTTVEKVAEVATEKPTEISQLLLDPTIGLAANLDKIQSCKQLKTVKRAAEGLGLNLADESTLNGGLNVVKDFYCEQIKAFFNSSTLSMQKIEESTDESKSRNLQEQVKNILTLCNTSDEYLLPISDSDQSISETSPAVVKLSDLRPELNQHTVTNFVQTFFDTPEMSIDEATKKFLVLTNLVTASTTSSTVAKPLATISAIGTEITPSQTVVGMYVSVYWGESEFPETKGWLEGKVIEIVEGIEEGTQESCTIPVIQYGDGDIKDFDSLYPILDENGKGTRDENGELAQFLAGTKLRVSSKEAFEAEQQMYAQ